MAEVLITLSILGIIAAVTIPNIVQRYNERVTVSKVKIAYNIINNIVEQAIILNGPLSTWDIGDSTANGAASIKLMEILEPNFQYAKKCGTVNNGECIAKVEEYKTFTDKQSWIWPSGKHTDNDNAVNYILKNGIAFRFYSLGNASCRQNSGNCFTVAIDVNGGKKPNKVGIDYFSIAEVYSNYGERIYNIKLNKGACTYKGTSEYNGWGCPIWILNKGNMDYLRRDISNEYNMLTSP